MTNLTEQWNKGKLPEGFYYCRLDNNGKDVIAPFYLSKTMIGKQFVKEALVEVPSFELWEAVHIQWKVLLEENTKLKKQVNHLSKTQARQFRDNQKLQVKAEHAKDVVNIDTARQIKQLKELLKRCKRHINASFPEIYRELLQEITQVLGEK